MTGSLSATWPCMLRRFLTDRFGEPAALDRLGGMSGGSVARLHGADTTIIVKRSQSPVETFVYTRLSGLLAEHGIAIPRLYWSGQDGDDFWLVIEDIPHPLPLDRRGADAEVVAMLRRLHRLPLDRVPLPPGAYTPAWPAALTPSALRLFPAADRDELAVLLETVRTAALPLFTPVCPISGDPNPLNWGLRTGSGLALFDWERFTLATPAIDLAIIAPGLGTAAVFRSIAARYLQQPEDAGEVRDLAHQIRQAKVWSVVELLSQVAQGDVQPSFSVPALIAQVNTWLRDVNVT